ncbi:MAG TPA: hypothetical protein VHG29_07020 [Novosphingobium sp.]|nr:hypothetical protein [Novosphingobium sp.]
MRARTRRGQPLVALVVLLSGWVAVRAAIWQPPAALPQPGATGRSAVVVSVQPALGLVSPQRTALTPQAMPKDLATSQFDASSPSGPTSWLLPLPVEPHDAAPALAPQPPLARPVPVRIAAGHQLLWLAALSQLPLPPEMTLLQGGPPNRDGTARFPYRSPEAVRRWSADGWILWRRGRTGIASSGFAPASYGASQAGAVIRYRLAPGSEHRPTFYLRASTALRSPRDEEVAAGFAVRPLARIPVVATAELRATRFTGGETLRPALALVSEFPPLRLPLGARAEAYGQAGYVGGKGATAFVDGQLRVDRPLLKMGRAELRAGGGAWGGAQHGASRVDVGPSATLGLPLGGGGARVALDWRFRVASDAAPASGPAVTLSAGF